MLLYEPPLLHEFCGEDAEENSDDSSICGQKQALVKSKTPVLIRTSMLELGF